MTTLSLIGAGGKMGCRITDHLRDHPGYRMLYVETGTRGLEALSQRGVGPTPRGEALAAADAVILAVPDRVLSEVAREVVPHLKSQCLVITLDPAVAHAGALPARADISYFVTHPCHPDVFDHFETPAERDDFFGGIHARQAVVCALMQGPEAAYATGERIARDIYAPVTRAHRVTVEQMAILEPTMAETCGIALVMALREALEEAVRRGVPRAAAEDFLYGHIKVELGIAFGKAPFPFSDGARLIAEYGRHRLMRPDWKQVFEPVSVREQVERIVRAQP
ncbi:MAG: semialdehyde dehydrogenase [Verrucomicrobiae bacterium]|nr:semialdehyde dehydrogenase [Verrucomicrobiae bacterium]